ncbi:hypothetical protein FBU30_009203 [Linnemannia zychae]|nr:hypothetical protein FBU30_009203 [Linnemannia zychae]
MLTTNPANGASKANASTRTINQLEQLHQLPPRLAGNTNSNNTSYPAQRTRSLRSYKPLTISTQKPMGTGSIAQMHGNTGSGQEVNTPTSTRTPRSASVRRKPVAAVPCSPVTSTPPSATGNNKLLQSRVYPSASLTTLPGMNKSRTSKANSNTTYDQQDMNGKLSSAASFVNGSHINFNQGWNTAQNSSINGDGIDNTALPPRDHSMDNDNGCHPDHSDAGRGRSKSSWDMIDDDKIVNWELNKTVPTSHYEDEAFGLWIRPNHEARTTISGADVEKAEKEDANGRDTYNYPGGGAKKKKNKPELEDMEVLEEMERSIRHHNIRTLKDYQDHVMADIGCAIQAMNEIYDQQERPFGHPDNFGRDTKPRLGVRSPPVIIPPNRAAQANSVNGRSKGSSRHGATTNQSNFGNGPRVNYASNASLHIQSPQKQSSNQQHTLASSVMSPFKKHRRHISVPASKPTITSMITSIKQSIPSPISMHSTHSTRGNNEGGYSHPYYSSYPDGTPFVSGFPPGAPTSYSQADSQEPLHHSMQHSFTSSMLSNSGGGIGGACGNYGGSHYSIAGMSTTSGGGGFLPQSIQTVINSFRHSAIGGGGHSVGGHSLIPSASSQFMPHPNNLSNSPVPLSKQEEKRLHLENQWRVDIMRRKAHLRGWACRAFMTLYEFSLQSAVSSLQEEFRDLYRIIRSIVEVDATATEKSHEVLAMVLAQAQEHEREPFQLRYSHYNSPAPTGKEIREANEEAIRRFEALYKDEEYKKPDTAMTDTDTVDHDNRVAPWIPIPDRMNECMQEDSPISSESLSPSSISSSSARTPSLTYCSSTSSSPTTLTSPCYLSAYDNMDLFGLQRHTVWDPLMDRLTKFDTTHHELDARNIFHFFRRMSLDSPSISEPPCQYLLSDEARDELLAVLWVLEKCVRERPDAQQSPTWFRLSSSASAVQAVFQAGGVIPYLKELQRKDPKQRDPIQTVHPVTLTGYFKRLLKDCGGLLLKETTALFVELARPATDNGDFWNLEKLSQIDRALLYRVICLDYNRGRVFLRISRVMEQILESSPKDMELDAFALSKMVQVVELSGVLDLKALRRWNGAWSSIILGYM